MSAASLVAFNLLVNGLGSFALALLLSRAALRLFRPAPGPAQLTLVALPFLKLAVDLAHGVPAGSFLWLRARGVPQELGSFQLGFGASYLIPKIQLSLGALSHGQLYTQSAADLAAAFLARKVGPWAPAAVAAPLLAVAAARLALRARAFLRAASERRALPEGALLVGRRRVGRRSARLFVSDAIAGSPFTGGLLAPYVAFPRRLWERLSPVERRAALAHELAHVAEHHVLLVTLAALVGDLFWFVPGSAAVERRLREACELAADARAVRRGTPPAALASTLLRAREETRAPAAARAPTLAASETSLRLRLTRLLEAPPPPRLGFQHPLLRAALTLWVAAIAVTALAFGNH